METFLICRKLAEYLRGNFLDENASNFFEETALKAISRTLSTGLKISDIELLFSELPKFLPLNYPIVKSIFDSSIQIIPLLLMAYRNNMRSTNNLKLWNKYAQMNERLNTLKAFQKFYV